MENKFHRLRIVPVIKYRHDYCRIYKKYYYYLLINFNLFLHFARITSLLGTLSSSWTTIMYYNVKVCCDIFAVGIVCGLYTQLSKPYFVCLVFVVGLHTMSDSNCVGKNLIYSTGPSY